MRCIHELYLRLPALGCTTLAAIGTALMTLSCTSCSFLRVKYGPNSPQGGILISGNNDDFDEFGRYNIGIFCSSFYDSDDDMMWELIRGFTIAAAVFMILTLSLSLGLSTCVEPSIENWRALTIVSISTAALEVPIFMFYKIKPCKDDQVECSAGAGFFLQLYCVIVAVSLTVVTICFSYPQWKQQIDGWKFQERGIFFEDYDDCDIEDANEYNIPPSLQSKEIFQRYSDSPYRVKARIVPVHEDHTMHEGMREKKHTLKKKFGRRKSTAADELYLMLDDAQSGMSDSPREYIQHKSLIDDNSIRNEDDYLEDIPRNSPNQHMKHPADSNDMKDSAAIDSLVLKKTLGEELPSPLPVTQDRKTRSFKKGNENVTYVVLTDSDDESDTNEDSDVIQFTPPEIMRGMGYMKQLDSTFSHVLGHEDEHQDELKTSNNVEVSDKVQIIGVSSGTKEYVTDVTSSIPSASATQSTSDECHSMHNISDNEEESDVYRDLDDNCITNNDDTKSLLQNSRTFLSDQDESFQKYPVQQARRNENTTKNKSSNVNVIPHHPAHHLNALIASLSFLNSNQHYKSMNKADDERKASKWLDVLESLNEEDLRNSRLKARQDYDIDDETSHAMMVENLQTRNVTDVMKTSLSSTRLDETAIVTDDEVSVEIASETVYDDEVEV